LTEYRYGHARINFLLRVAAVVLSVATYTVGVVLLIFGPLLLAIYLTYRWLRDGVWHSLTLAEVLMHDSAVDRPAQTAGWLYETPLLMSVPAVGGLITVAGIVGFIAFGVLLDKPVQPPHSSVCDRHGTLTGKRPL
jgi:hypothetical protein